MLSKIKRPDGQLRKRYEGTYEAFCRLGAYSQVSNVKVCLNASTGKNYERRSSSQTALVEMWEINLQTYIAHWKMVSTDVKYAVCDL